MFFKNDFVIDKESGLGKILEVQSSYLKIAFKNEDVFEDSKKYIDRVVPEKLINIIARTKTIQEFDSPTLYKAINYANPRTIKDGELVNNKLEFKVEGNGNKIYTTSIGLSLNNRLVFTCNCPVGRRCKHQAAVLEYLNNQIETINKKNTIEEYKLDDLYNLTECIKDGFPNAQGANKLLKVFNSIGFCNTLKDFLTYISNDLYKQNKDLAIVVILILSQSKVREQDVIKTLRSNNLEELISIYYDGKNFNIYAINSLYSFCLLYLMSYELNKNYFFERLMFYSHSKSFIKEKLFLYDNIIENFLNDKNLYNIIRNYNFNEYDLGNEVVEKISKKLSNTELFALINNNNFPVIDFSCISLSKEDVIDNFMEIKAPLLFNYLKSHKEQVRENIPTYFNVLSYLYTQYDYKNEIRDLLNGVDDYKNLIYYIENRCLNSFDYYYETIDNNENIKRQRVVASYFEVGYEFLKIYGNENLIKIIKYLLVKGKNRIVNKSSFQYNINTKRFSHESQDYNYAYCVREDGYYYDLIKDKKFLDDLNIFIDEIKLEIIRKKEAALLNNIKKLDSYFINDYKSNIKSNAKVGLSYYFTSHEKYPLYNYNIFLQLEIGNVRMYKVKNIQNLSRAFLEQEYVEYGKSLAFYHKLSNLKDEDRAFMEYLIDSKISSIGSVDYSMASISKRDVDNIFKILKGREIFFNGYPYYVDENDSEFYININSNYTLNVDTNKKYFLMTKNNVYMFDKTKHTLSKLKNINPKVLTFALDNNGVSLKNVAGVFSTNIYSRYKDNFIIDENIKEDFKPSILEIESYFDLIDNKKIELKTKYKIDDMYVSDLNIKSERDLLSLELYKNAISDIGFEDGILNENSLLNFLSMDFSELKTLTKVFLSDSIVNKKISNFSNTTFKVKYENNLVSIFKEKSNYSDDELRAIFKAIKYKKKYIILNDDVIKLDNKEAKDFYDVMDDFNLEKEDLENGKSLPLYESFKMINKDNITIDSFVEKMIKDIASYKKSDIKLPELNATLREYQKEGFKWLKILENYNLGGILADDMGLGKTIQIISLITSNDKKMPSLIVCPKSLVFNWKNEFNVFSPNEKIVQIYGGKNDRANIIKSIKKDEKIIYITSYDSLRNDIDLYDDKNFLYMIIDEGQYIKNQLAQKTISIKKVKAQYRYCLTGTPIENNIYDLYSIFDFLMPSYLPKIKDFQAKFEKEDNYIEVISKKVAPFILRRCKQDVLKELPKKYERILTCELEKDQRKLYDAHINVVKEMMESKESKVSILSYLTKLREICINPSLIIENYHGNSGKMNELFSIIENYINDNHKLLVFSTFVRAINIIKEELDKKKIKYYVITGDTKASDRVELCNQFNKNDEIKVFLISLMAGGSGLNLTGADTVIHLDPWWNKAREDQASDRAHRIGQEKNVEVIKLIAQDTIEQKVIELQNLKKDLIDKVISNNDESISKLSYDDIKYLLS